MSQRGRGDRRRPGGYALLLGAALALLALMLWRLQRSVVTSSRTLVPTSVVSARLLRSAQPKTAGLTELVSAKRFGSTRAARFLHLPHYDDKHQDVIQSDAGAGIGQSSAAKVWEYLMQHQRDGNIGQGRRQTWPVPATLQASNRRQATFAGTSVEMQNLNMSGDSADGQGWAAAHAALPDNFDWQTYLLYYPDLEDHGIATEAGAQQHYLEWGRGEGRLYRRVRVLLRYTACTGLINQHYSHIAAFALASAVHAELVLAPAVQRDSFEHYFSQSKEQNEVQWTPVPLESLLDVPRIIEACASRGMIVHKTPALLPFPDLTEPQTAFPLFPQPELDEQYVVRLKDVYLRNLDMKDLVELVRDAVVAHAGQLASRTGDPDAHPPYIVLDLPCTFFMLSTHSALGLVSDVARTLRFAPALEALAARIVANMTHGGRLPYNSAHLRFEKDARDWSIIMGGKDVIWDRYVRAMQDAGFSDSIGVYVASGLLTYGASREMDDIEGTLLHHHLATNMLYKELFLPAEELEALSSEQKALVDFIVLSGGSAFVGFGSSTFSFYLREHRALQGIDRASSVLVDASIIGTDALFESAGVVV